MLLLLIFCIELVREILFFSGKRQGTLNSNARGNRVFVVSGSLFARHVKLANR